MQTEMIVMLILDALKLSMLKELWKAYILLSRNFTTFLVHELLFLKESVLGNGLKQ